MSVNIISSHPPHCSLPFHSHSTPNSSRPRPTQPTHTAPYHGAHQAAASKPLRRPVHPSPHSRLRTYHQAAVLAFLTGILPRPKVAMLIKLHAQYLFREAPTPLSLAQATGKPTSFSDHLPRLHRRSHTQSLPAIPRRAEERIGCAETYGRRRDECAALDV